MRLVFLLSTALALISIPAQGQQKPARVETSAVITHFNVATDAAGRDRASALFQNLNELRRLQEIHYADHGRFAVSASDLPEFKPIIGAQIHTTTGGNWLTIQAFLPNVVAYGVTLWPKGSTGIISGTFSDMDQFGQISRPR